MGSVSRRDFLFASSGAVAGNMLVPGLLHGSQPAHGGQDFSESGLVTGRPKPLRHKSIPGFLSAEQIAPHHRAHYGGALNGYVKIDAALTKATKSGKPIEPAAYGALQRGRASKANSVVLHEFYFDGLAPQAPDPAVEVRTAIKERFGSIDKWADDFQASAKAAAGWAILAHHPVNKRLYNIVSDEHAMGPLWMAAPLVVIDVYEHAYYIDYHNRKADYVSKFMSHVDWDEVGRRYRAMRT